MSLGIAPCKANSGEANACSGNFVDQVLKSTLVKAMVTTGSPSVSLSWVASTSPNITGYDVLRSQTTVRALHNSEREPRYHHQLYRLNCEGGFDLLLRCHCD